MAHNIVLEFGGKNIFSFGNNEVKLDLRDKKNILFYGSNGSGKSSMRSILDWVLFEKTDKGVKKADVINDINKKECYGYAELICGGKHIKIERGYKPDILNLYIDNELQNENAAKADLQQIILDILGCDYSEYNKLVSISKTNYKSILELSKPERRNFKDNLLGLNSFTRMLNLVKEDIKSIKSNITNREYSVNVLTTQLSGERQSYENELSDIMNSINKLKSDLEEIVERKIPSLKVQKLQDIQTVKNEIDALKQQDNSDKQRDLLEQISKLETDLQEKQSKLKRLEGITYPVPDTEVMTNLNNIRENYYTEHGKVSLRFSKLNNQVKEKENSIRKCITEKTSKISRIDNDLFNIKNELCKIKTDGMGIAAKIKETEDRGVCPTCDQTLVNDKVLSKMKDQLNEGRILYKSTYDIIAPLTNEKTNLRDAINKQEMLLQECLNETNQIESEKYEEIKHLTEQRDKKVKGYEDELKERSIIKNNIIILSSEIKSLIGQIQTLKERDVDASKNNNIIRLTEKLEALKNKDYLYEINLQKKYISDQINDLQCKNLDNKLSRIKELEEQLTNEKMELDILNDNLKYKTYMTTMLDEKGIKSQVVDRYVPFINERVNIYLDKMGFFVNFNLDKNFDETIAVGHTKEKSFNSFSEGERQRIALSTIFAFRDVALAKNFASFNILFLDDMTGHVDDESKDYLLDMINDGLKDVIPIIVNHDYTKFNGHFDTICRFTKNKYTKMEIL